MWELADLYPLQGEWTEDDYFELERRIGNSRLIELCDGCIEIQSRPDIVHQLVLMELYRGLEKYAVPLKRGLVVVSPLPVRFGKGHYREPDLCYI